MVRNANGGLGLLEAAGRLLMDHRGTGQQETFRVEEIGCPDSFRAGGG